MSTFNPGDRVYVTDPGLEALRDFMRVAFRREPEPNHHGVVAEVRDTGDIVVTFDDDDTSAPYPANQVHHLTT